jgi:hypothetical protein
VCGAPPQQCSRALEVARKSKRVSCVAMLPALAQLIIYSWSWYCNLSACKSRSTAWYRTSTGRLLRARRSAPYPECWSLCAKRRVHLGCDYPPEPPIAPDSTSNVAPSMGPAEHLGMAEVQAENDRRRCNGRMASRAKSAKRLLKILQLRRNLR